MRICPCPVCRETLKAQESPATPRQFHSCQTAQTARILLPKQSGFRTEHQLPSTSEGSSDQQVEATQTSVRRQESDMVGGSAVLRINESQCHTTTGCLLQNPSLRLEPRVRLSRGKTVRGRGGGGPSGWLSPTSSSGCKPHGHVHSVETD